MFNKNEHIELFKAITNACTKSGLNVKHPAVQKAMADLHMKIKNAMPKSTDAARANEVAKRGPVLVREIKRNISPEHFADGGIAELTGNQQTEQPVGQEQSPPPSTQQGTTNLAMSKGGKVKCMADGGPADPNDEDDSTPPVNIPGVDTTVQPVEKRDLGQDVSNLVTHVKNHPIRSAVDAGLLASMVVGNEGAPAEVAGLEGASEAAPEVSSLAERLMGNGAKTADEAAPTVNTATEAEPVAQPPESGDTPAENTGESPTQGNTNENTTTNDNVRNGNDNSEPSNKPNSNDTNGNNGSAANNGNRPGLLPKVGKVAGYAATAALGAGAGALLAPSLSKIAPAGPAVNPSTIPPELQSGAPSPTSLAPNTPTGGSPTDAKVASGNNEDVRNAFTNSTENLNRSTAPIPGMQPGLNQSVNTARQYAATQTPDAMNAANKDKTAVLGAGLAASLTPFGGGGANTQGAISALANAPGQNLEQAQKYGNTSQHLLNNSLADTANTQGTNINNAITGRAPGVVGALGVNTAAQKLQTDTNDFKTITTNLQQMGPSGNAVIQAIFSGDGAKAAAAISKITDPVQRSAALSVLAIAQKKEHQDLMKAGVLDSNSLITTMKNTLDNDHTAAKGASAAGNILSGQTSTMPQQYAEGGKVEDDQDYSSDNVDDTGSDIDPDFDTVNMTDPDILKRAFGMIPKGGQVTNDQTAPIQDDKGNTIGQERDVEVTSPPQVTETEGPVGKIVDAIKGEIPMVNNTPETAGDTAPTNDVSSMVAQEATKQGVDPKLAVAIMKTESNGDPAAINHNSNGTSDFGPMQVNSSNYAHSEDTSDVALNVQKGVGYLKHCLDVAGGDPQTAAVLYHHGAASRLNPQFIKNDPYGQKVMSNYANS